MTNSHTLVSARRAVAVAAAAAAAAAVMASGNLSTGSDADPLGGRTWSKSPASVQVEAGRSWSKAPASAQVVAGRSWSKAPTGRSWS